MCDPVSILVKAYKLLRPGGIIFVYTPNFDCAERLIMDPECHFIWGSNHLVYFTVETLWKALEQVGFEVVHYETQGLDVEDMIWWFKQTGEHETDFLKEFCHELQFLFNVGR